MDHAPHGRPQPGRAPLALDRARLQRLIDLLDRYDLAADAKNPPADLSIELRRFGAALA